MSKWKVPIYYTVEVAGFVIIEAATADDAMDVAMDTDSDDLGKIAAKPTVRGAKVNVVGLRIAHQQANVFTGPPKPRIARVL